MSKVPELVPMSDLRQDVAAVLKRLQASREPLVITQRGRAAAVFLSIDAYERREQERELLQLLARGEKECAMVGVPTWIPCLLKPTRYLPRTER